MSDKYSRDTDYKKPLRWDRLYKRHFPANTDPASRHVVMLAHECLRHVNSPIRRILIDAGYEPDHWAESMEATVKALWEARAETSRPQTGNEGD